MIKGGYKIVNFNGTALSSTAVELTGIYDQIVDDYDKPIMVSGVTISGKLQDDAYADVQEKTAQDLSKSVELTVYGGIITVTEDDEVSFVVSKSPTELTAEIGDLEDLDTTDKDSVVDAINEVNGELIKIATLSASLVIDYEDTQTIGYRTQTSGIVDITTLTGYPTGHTVLASLVQPVNTTKGAILWIDDNKLRGTSKTNVTLSVVINVFYV